MKSCGCYRGKKETLYQRPGGVRRSEGQKDVCKGWTASFILWLASLLTAWLSNTDNNFGLFPNHLLPYLMMQESFDLSRTDVKVNEDVGMDSIGASSTDDKIYHFVIVEEGLKYLQFLLVDQLAVLYRKPPPAGEEREVHFVLRTTFMTLWILQSI